MAPLVAVARRFQWREAIVRLLSVAQSQPDVPLDDILDQERSLQHHTVGQFVSHLYEPLVLLGSPFTRGFAAGRGVEDTLETVLLVFMGANGEGALLQNDDTTWTQVYETDLPTLREVAADGTTWMRQTNHHVINIDAPALLKWWTNGLNRLYTEVTDLGRYRQKDGLLDAGRANREMRSLERIIANRIRIQARPTDHLTRVALAYEFFNLLPNIVHRDVGPNQVWERLANPANAKALLGAAFHASSGSIGTCLRARAEAVLTKLAEETIQHVIPSPANAKKIIVGTKEYPNGAYIAPLLHQLRNTHHGYELDSVSKIALLASNTCHVSDTFPELVVLLTIALIADGKAALDGDWF